MADFETYKGIVEAFSKWSKKYPRGTVYHMANKSKMDGELIALEESAKKLVESKLTSSNISSPKLPVSVEEVIELVRGELESVNFHWQFIVRKTYDIIVENFGR